MEKFFEVFYGIKFNWTGILLVFLMEKLRWKVWMTGVLRLIKVNGRKKSFNAYWPILAPSYRREQREKTSKFNFWIVKIHFS